MDFQTELMLIYFNYVKKQFIHSQQLHLLIKTYMTIECKIKCDCQTENTYENLQPMFMFSIEHNLTNLFDIVTKEFTFRIGTDADFNLYIKQHFAVDLDLDIYRKCSPKTDKLIKLLKK